MCALHSLNEEAVFRISNTAKIWQSQKEGHKTSRALDSAITSIKITAIKCSFLKGNFYGIYSTYHFIMKYSECANHFVSLSLKMNRLD